MGRTHAQKLAAREARLRALPQSERLVKSALIKKKERRVLDAAEKHALKMTSEHGDILRLWEQLRTTAPAASSPSSSSATAATAAAAAAAATKHGVRRAGAAGDADDDDNDGNNNNNNNNNKVSGNNKDAEARKKDAFAHKYPMVEQLMRLIEARFASLIRTPSISRVVQSMIKYGSTAHLRTLLRWFARDFVALATDAYAHFALCALVRHATHDTFRDLLTCVVGAVPQLVSHTFGVEVLHATYSSRWCAAHERDVLLLGVFKDSAAVQRHWVGYPVLADVLAHAHATAGLQRRLLQRLFDVCDTLVSRKQAIGYPFAQRLVYEFLRHGTRDEVSELCDTVRPHVADIAATREGGPLVSLVFALSPPKKRKAILLSLRSTLGELAMSKYGAPVLARIFDFMYDTQLLRKYVVNDLVAHMPQLVRSPHAYQILMHLLTPTLARKRRFLLPHWHAHNLFALENAAWNRHTWLTAQLDAEVVEVCGKSAMTSHVAVLPVLVEAFVQHIRGRDRDGDGGSRHGERAHDTAATPQHDEDAADASSLSSRLGLYERLLAREIVHVVDTQPAYKAALQLSDDAMAVLHAASAARGDKRERTGDADRNDDDHDHDHGHDDDDDDDDDKDADTSVAAVDEHNATVSRRRDVAATTRVGKRRRLDGQATRQVAAPARTSTSTSTSASTTTAASSTRKTSRTKKSK